ncbi:hypothetical protein D9M68_335410 [compost metagenome]
MAVLRSFAIKATEFLRSFQSGHFLTQRAIMQISASVLEAFVIEAGANAIHFAVS